MYCKMLWGYWTGFCIGLCIGDSGLDCLMECVLDLLYACWLAAFAFFSMGDEE